MKYVNANTLLPAVLVEELQGYIQGGYKEVIFMCLCAKTNQNIGENCPAIGKN